MAGKQILNALGRLFESASTLSMAPTYSRILMEMVTT